MSRLSWLDPRLPELGREFGTALLLAAVGLAVALLAHRLLYGLLDRLARASESKVDDVVVGSLRSPTRYAMVALGLALAARESSVLAEIWDKLAGFLMPALIGWIALSGLNAFVRASTIEADLAPIDDQTVRRRRTRLAIFARIGAFLIVFATVGLMLLALPGVRDLGLTLMASAGLAGIAVGAAAQPALKSLIAGLQMALTEPINIEMQECWQTKRSWAVERSSPDQLLTTGATAVDAPGAALDELVPVAGHKAEAVRLLEVDRRLHWHTGRRVHEAAVLPAAGMVLVDGRLVRAEHHLRSIFGADHEDAVERERTQRPRPGRRTGLHRGARLAASDPVHLLGDRLRVDVPPRLHFHRR